MGGEIATRRKGGFLLGQVSNGGGGDGGKLERRDRNEPDFDDFDDVDARRPVEDERRVELALLE